MDNFNTTINTFCKLLNIRNEDYPLIDGIYKVGKIVEKTFNEQENLLWNTFSKDFFRLGLKQIISSDYDTR